MANIFKMATKNQNRITRTTNEIKTKSQNKKKQKLTRHRASTEHSLTFRFRTMSSYHGADASL